MPWILKLSDGTTTVDLSDGTNTYLNWNGFYAPPPPVLTSYAGNNLSRHGADLVERSYGNRSIDIDFQIRGSAVGTLVSKVQAVNDMLRRAEEFAKTGYGSQVQLLYGWNNASGTVAFNLLEGTLDLGQNLHSPYLSTGTIIHNARLRLMAEPFAIGTKETISNILADPSFEIAGTPLGDWTVGGQSLGGTQTRDTSVAKYGTASMKWTIGTTGAGSGSNAQRYQLFALPTGTTGTYFAFAWVRADAATNCTFELRAEIYNTAGGGPIVSTIATLVGTNSTFQKISVSFTATGSGSLYINQFVRLTSATATGTYFSDGIFAGTNTTLPSAWISGRDVKNHFDDNGQAHINYIDVYDVPGDIPAIAQIVADEVEAHTVFWGASRSSSRQKDGSLFLEAENGTTTVAVTKVAVGDASNGSVMRIADVSTTPTTTGTSRILIDIPAPPQGLYRVLTRMLVRSPDAGATSYIGVGYTYGSVTNNPTATADYVVFGTGTQNFGIVDAGFVTIPPINTPVSSTIGTFTLRLPIWISSDINNTATVDVDWIMLMPADEGFLYGTKASAQQRVRMDSETRPHGLYLLTTGDVVQSFPVQQGNAPLVHTKGTRIYFVGSTGTADITAGWTVQLTYTPRYIHV